MESMVEIKVNPQQSPLAKHVCPFAKNGFFSPATVRSGLDKIHSDKAELKANFIAGFNSAHSGNWTCPFGETQFKADLIEGYSKYLHLGTTRIWNSDGTFNVERWQQFENAVASEMIESQIFVVTKTAVNRYLTDCYHKDPQESSTGRNAHSWFSSGFIQSTAAIAAWDEVFKRLACGWIFNESDNSFDPYIDLDLVCLFFEDTGAAFKRAESRDLPVPKPGGYDITLTCT